MTCEQARRDLAFYLYHELTFEQEESLELHLDGCAACRRELERERALHRAMDVSADEPSAELLASCRREFDRRVSLEAARPSPWARLRKWMIEWMPYRPALRPLAAMALLAMGFFGARLWDATKASSEPSLVRVRSVNADPRGGGLQMVVEEVRQKNFEGRLEDPRVRQMLLAAAGDASDPGLQVQTLDLLQGLSEAQADPLEVRRAMLRALAADTNAGVRLKAMEGLRRFTADPETRRVLSTVVLADENPGVRTQAIELLLERPEVESIGTLQELIMRENNPYIRSRTLNALRALNASAETF